MKVKVEDLKDSQKLIRIEVEAERVSAVLNDVYGDIKKTARVPGYRVGNAPRDLLEVHHGRTANEETLNRLIWERYREAVIQEGLDPVGYPVIENVDFDKEKPLVFTVKVDVRPEFKLRHYRGIKIKEQPCEVTDDDIDKALKDLQESAAQYKNIEDRPLLLGDYVVCEYECYSDGKLVDKNDKLWLYMSDQLQPKELLSLLLGTKKDIAKEVEVVHPKDYQYKELAGEKALYKITPKQIKQKILPEINDDLAKGTGHFKDLQGLKNHLRESLLRTKQTESQRNLQNQIFDSLLKSHSFEVPHSAVERQTEHLVKDTKLKLIYQGYKKENLDKEDESLRKALWENAKKSVRISFILEKIAKEQGIEVEDRELNERIERIAKNTNEDHLEVKKRLQERNLLGNLREQILQDKVVDLLLKEARKT